MKVFCKEFVTIWTRGLVRWLSRKFDSISIDLTPVEEKLDEVKSDVADVKTAVENIDFSTLAKQGTNADATLTAVLEALTGGDEPSPDIPEGVAERLAMILEFFGIKTIGSYEFMTDKEVTDELEDIMQALDNELTPEQAAAITTEAMQIIVRA